MALLIIVIVGVIVAWLVVSLPIAVIVGRITRRADLGSDDRELLLVMESSEALAASTGTVGTIRR